MPPLERENGTYREFFSPENCNNLYENETEQQLLENFADSIPDIIRDEIHQLIKKGKIRRGEEQEDLELIPQIAQVLKKFVSDIQNSPQIKDEMIKRLPALIKKRIISIKKQRELARKINLDRRNCNISSSVGSATGILGGLLLAAGAVVTAATGGAAAPLVVPGLIASGLGSGTSLGTSIVGTNRLSKFVKEAQKVAAEDKLNFKHFSNALEQTLENQGAIQYLLNISLLRKTIADIGSLIRKTCHYKKKIDDMQGKIRIFVNTYLTQNGEIANIQFWITTLSLLVGFIFALVSIRNQNSLIYESGMCILKIGLTVCRFLDIGVDAFTAGLTSLRAGGAVVAKSVGRAAAHGALAVLSIGLDTATFVLASIDLTKGSISEYATKINEAADELERGLHMLQTLQGELN